jgi:hypothetical protein
MRRPVDHAALSAIGYFAELGVQAGSDPCFHLSIDHSEAPIRLVRFDRAAGPESTAWPISRPGAPPTVRGLDLGSWLAIEPDVRFLNAWRWALELEFRLAGLPAGRTLIAGAECRCALRS